MEPKIQESEEKVALLQRTNEELTSQIEHLTNQLTENQNVISLQSQNEEKFKLDIVEDKKIITELQSQLSQLNEQNQNLSAEMETIRNANEMDRQTFSEDLESEKKRLINDIDTLNRTLDQNRVELKDLSDKNADLISELEGRAIQLNEKEAEVDELKGALDKLQQKRSQENEELLSEMREINEALKNRGDVISKQKQSIGELNDKIEQLQQQVAQLNVTNDSGNKQIEQLNDRIKELESRSFVDGGFIKMFNLSPHLNRRQEVVEIFFFSILIR